MERIYNENVGTIPSVWSFDLPLLTDEELQRLTEGTGKEELQRLIEDSADAVKNFDPQEAADMARTLARAAEALDI